MRTITKIFIITILIFGFTDISFSQYIDNHKAAIIAIEFLKKHFKSEKDCLIEEIIPFGNNKDTSVFIVNFSNNNGFIIIPSYNTSKKIIGYSKNNKFDLNNIPPALSDLLRYHSEEIEQEKKNKHNDIQNIESYFADNKSQNNIIQPLISTKWDQACFYNDSCPNAPNSGAYFCQKVPAGCVAIALAQIMKFHKYPLTGTGFNSYYNAYYGNQYANFGNTNYSYNNMPNVLYSKNPTTAQFIYHNAVSVNTQFNYQYSGANITDAKNALINFFNYSNSAQIVQKNNFTDSCWSNLLKNELDSTRPVFLSGYNQNNAGGHAFVCDGYDNNNLFHINWGWGGMYDGYYLLTSLSHNSNNFSYNQSAIIKIIPQNNYPVCHFKANKNLVNINEQVSFTDISTGNVSQYKWIFEGGNPSISTLKNPVITYNQPGIFKVTLIVSNINGSDTLTKTNFITVTPFADFSSNKTKFSKQENVQFYDKSLTSDSITSYNWIFQGGQPTVSNLKNPIVTYNQAGTYSVSLTIITNNGSHNIIKNNYITVYNQCNYLFKDSVPNYYINPQNLANFQIFQEDFDSLTPYYTGHTTKWNIFKQVLSPGDTNSFYGAASIFTTAGQANNWLEFGPITVPANGATLKWKHLYYLNNKRDGYEILLSTTGLTKDYYISPPVFSRLDNDPKTDGNTSWTPQEINIPPNIYGNSDIYIAFHHFANNMYYLFIDDIELLGCSGLPIICDFKADTTNILPGNSVNFTDLSSGNPISWEWTFYGGTPSYSLEQNPQDIKYLNPGVYPVKLKVFNGENYDSITKTNFINVNANDIENYQEFSNIKISPNPAKDYINVSFTTLTDDTFLLLFDIHGRKIYEKLLKKGSHEQTIELNNLKNGYYIIKLINNLNWSFGFNKLIILK